MSLLAGITGHNVSAASARLEPEAENAYGENSLVKLSQCSEAMDAATSRLANLLNASATVDVVKVESPDARVLARVMVAEKLADMDMPSDAAVAATAGLESESADVGLEAFSTVKEYAIKAIEWIQAKWKELKKWVAKYFNKYFGDVERLKDQWTGILEKSKERQSGYTLEKNSKHEFEKGSDAFFLNDKIASPEELEKGVQLYRTIGEAIMTKVMDYQVVELDSADILNADGTGTISKTDFEGKVKVGNVVAELEKSLKSAIPANAPAKFAGLTGKFSGALLGRVGFYVGSKESDDLQEVIKSTKFGIADLADEQKVKTKANMELASAAKIEALADANIEMLDTIVNMKRNKSLDKAETQLDKASKALEKWKKNAPDSSEGADKRSAYREAVKVATEYFSLGRRLLITMPLEFCNQAKMVSTMHKDFANRSLAAHKKD